jgi:hypothetical protein
MEIVRKISLNAINHTFQITAKDISEDKGYLSHVYRVVIEFEHSERPAYSFIMKVPTMEIIEKMCEEMKIEGVG